MKFEAGQLLLDCNGQLYRVVDCAEGMVSLMRVNGYTLFSCNPAFVESMFQCWVPAAAM